MHLPFRHGHFPELDHLWIIAVVSNPQRYHSRYRLFEQFRKHIESAGAHMLTVETAFGARPHEATNAEHPHHLQLRTSDEIWHKESMINLGIQRLPRTWKYVAWVDADIEFMREDWVEEIVHQLQHYKVIQLFQNALDMGPNGEVMTVFDGFVHSWMNRQPPPYSLYYGSQKGPHWHPGFAWAARREAINDLGGLFDQAILGAADHHMAWALTGRVLQNSPEQLSEAYKRQLKMWQERANTHIRQNIGYMPGSIRHTWHGPKKARKYVERWSILHRHHFDPEQDLTKDWQGLLKLTARGERMRNDLREYFRQRNEDSIENP